MQRHRAAGVVDATPIARRRAVFSVTRQVSAMISVPAGDVDAPAATAASVLPRTWVVPARVVVPPAT